MMSSWIRPCTPSLFNKDLLGHQFRSVSSRESETFLYVVKHRAADREFNASSDWLGKFKTRHGIRNLSIQDEKLSAAEETVEPFLQKMHKVIGKESDPQANRHWTFVEVFTAKNSCFLSRKICSKIQKSKGSFKCAGLYKCYWNSQTKTRSM